MVLDLMCLFCWFGGSQRSAGAGRGAARGGGFEELHDAADSVDDRTPLGGESSIASDCVGAEFDNAAKGSR